MAKSWFIDGVGIAKKVKTAALSYAKQIKDSGATQECPSCHYSIDNSDVPVEWPGLPVGVKFDPSDIELLDHLAAKCDIGNQKPHVFIDEFIPTIETDKGICYTHPKYLPGARKDGSSVHFFYKTTNAYASGKRKRRKIQTEVAEETIRWHKTGKTKPVIENGVQKGYKKIMVLYRSLKKGSKPVKSNWVMHQYHLGNKQDEMEGEYVVAKIFFQQQKQCDKNSYDINAVKEESQGTSLIGPKTPGTCTPTPPTPGISHVRDGNTDDNIGQSVAQDPEVISGPSKPISNLKPKEDIEDLAYPPGKTKAAESDAHKVNLSPSNDVFCSCTALVDGFAFHEDGEDFNIGSYGMSSLLNMQLDTPPDFSLVDLQFGSQDSSLSWLDRL